MDTRSVRWWLLVAAALVITAVPAQARPYAPWGPAEPVEDVGGGGRVNTGSLDGCPALSPDGLSLYLASNRPRFEGDTRTDLDIWVARRSSKRAPFGDPVNLGPPVNSMADDFCPTPTSGGGLFFVSRRVTEHSCGLGDIYRTRRHPKRGWREPVHLGCEPHGPNSPLDEQGPAYVTAGRGSRLYFSRSSPTTPGDIFVSRSRGGSFRSARPVVELNHPTANDIQPNVRKDGRELVFSSNRDGTLGGQDIWISTRRSTGDRWSEPVNVGAVNTDAGETRPWLSRDARTLLFGRAPGPEGGSDIFVSTRRRT